MKHLSPLYYHLMITRHSGLVQYFWSNLYILSAEALRGEQPSQSDVSGCDICCRFWLNINAEKLCAQCTDGVFCNMQNWRFSGNLIVKRVRIVIVDAVKQFTLRNNNGRGWHCPRHLRRITHWPHCHWGRRSGEPGSVQQNRQVAYDELASTHIFYPVAVDLVFELVQEIGRLPDRPHYSLTNPENPPFCLSREMRSPCSTPLTLIRRRCSHNLLSTMFIKHAALR